MTERQGLLSISGGHEDKKGDKLILRALAEFIGGGELVIDTVASHEPEGYFDSYRAAFADLGVTNLTELYVNERVETLKEETADPLRDAAGVFFTGGDQLRISSQIGDTTIERMLWDIHRRGGLIAGTSAGAAVMSETMLVKGSSRTEEQTSELQSLMRISYAVFCLKKKKKIHKQKLTSRNK